MYSGESLISKMEVENVFFGTNDCEIDSNITYDSFSPSLDDLVPAWDEGFFSLGNGVVEVGMTTLTHVNNGESPSHESDSGMSSLGSPETVDTNAGDELTFNELIPANQNGMFDDQMDEDLFSYLTDSPPSTQMACSPSVSENEDIDKLLKNVYTGSKTVDVNMNVTEFESANLHCLRKSARECKTAARKKISETVTKEAAVLTNVVTVKPTSDTSTISKLPTVKVVRLVTPAGAGRFPSTQDLVRAFDDKNRKNAEQAKVNREKKKTYIKGLEEEVETLKTENQTLKRTSKSSDSEREKLKQEVLYLKSVLANQSSLSNLLKNIPSVKNVKLSSTFVSRKRSTEHDHDYESEANKSKAPKLAGMTGGVCLHVDKDTVSLEFCSNCAKMAGKSSEED